MDVTAVQYASFYQFLKTLDCYLGDDGQMIGEVQHFSENPRREISAFVTRETTDLIEVPSDFIRMLYIMKGSVRVAIDGSESCLSAGGLILTNAATKLSYNGDAEAEVIAFYFKPGYFTESLLGQFFEEPQLLKQVVKMAYFNNKVTKSAFVLLIVEISQAEPERLIAKDNFVSNGQLTEELLAYIDARLEQVTLEEVARKFHFHPNYLSSLLKEKTGHSFTEIVLLRKIERCKQYLEQTDLTAQAIVERLGYKDKAFFYKRFKQIEGVTPRQYRKMREEEN